MDIKDADNKVNYYKRLLDNLKAKKELCLVEINITQEKIQQYAETIDALEAAIEKMEE